MKAYVQQKGTIDEPKYVISQEPKEENGKIIFECDLVELVTFIEVMKRIKK